MATVSDAIPAAFMIDLDAVVVVLIDLELFDHIKGSVVGELEQPEEMVVVAVRVPASAESERQQEVLPRHCAVQQRDEPSAVEAVGVGTVLRFIEYAFMARPEVNGPSSAAGTVDLEPDAHVDAPVEVAAE